MTTSPAPELALSEAERAYRDALAIVRARSKALEGPSLAMRWARLPRAARERVRASLTPEERVLAAHRWARWARPKQRPPAELTDGMRIILWLMGRGGGKTKSAAERVRERVDAGAWSIALIGPTFDAVERYMVGLYERDEGLINVFPPHQRPEYDIKHRLLRFHTGATAYVYTAERPEVRGPNFDTVWGDEPREWRHLDRLWSNIELATRKPVVGSKKLDVEILLTSTPRPLQFFKTLVADPDCLTIVGVSDENPHNDERWLERQRRRLGTSREGRQELEAEILGDDPDALFWPTVLDETRVNFAPDGLRVVIPVDAAVSTHTKSDATGVVPIGIDDAAGHLYVLEDLTQKSDPDKWADDAIDAYERLEAVAFVYERNRAGDLIESNIRAAMLRRRGAVAAKALTFVPVYAKKYEDKAWRARPVSNLHRDKRLHIVGNLPELEQEITSWNPKLATESPNRLDAMVWGALWLANLIGDLKKDYRVGFEGIEQANEIIQQQNRPAPATSSLGSRHPATPPPVSALPPTAGAAARRHL